MTGVVEGGIEIVDLGRSLGPELPPVQETVRAAPQGDAVQHESPTAIRGARVDLVRLALRAKPEAMCLSLLPRVVVFI